MRKHVIGIHGWKGPPPWFPWLQEQLEHEKFLVTIPALPDPENPKEGAWLAAIASAVHRPGKRTFFVTHSLGAMAVLRYLEQLPKRKRIGGLVMVAGFSEWNERSESRDLFKTPLDYKKVRASLAKTPRIIMSTNDPFVPFDRYHKILMDNLGANLVACFNAGHFTKTRDDPRCWDKLPIVLGVLHSLTSS